MAGGLQLHEAAAGEVAVHVVADDRRGDDVVRTPGGFPIRVHSPVRLYYMHRNRVRLYSRPYVPLAWKVHDFGRMIVKLGLLMVFVPQRLSRLRAVVRGLGDGVRQRGGPYAG